MGVSMAIQRCLFVDDVAWKSLSYINLHFPVENLGSHIRTKLAILWHGFAM